MNMNLILAAKLGGCILPSCLIVTLIAHFYLKYREMSLLQTILKTLRPAVVALIASAGLSILITAFFQDTISFNHMQYHMIIIFMICLFLLMRKKINPIMVMFLAGILNVVYYYFMTLL